MKSVCWAKAPEGFQVEGRENRVSEGSCVGGWDHVADSGTPPCGQTGLGQRVLEESPFCGGCLQEEVWWVGKAKGKAEGLSGSREGSTCRIFSRSAKT